MTHTMGSHYSCIEHCVVAVEKDKAKVYQIEIIPRLSRVILNLKKVQGPKNDHNFHIESGLSLFS